MPSSMTMRRPAGDLHTFAPAQIALTPPFDLGEFAVTDRVEIRFLNAGKADDVLVAHDQRSATIHHGSHCQLRLERHADLAHENEIKRCVQRGRNLRGDGHAATGQRENDRLLVFVSHNRRSQLAPGVRPILKTHRALLRSRTSHPLP